MDDIARRVALATSAYTFRRRAGVLLSKLDICGEPAIDILLGLYIAHYRGRRLTITDACKASDAPYATALRRLWLLEERGFVRRVADRSDRRRGYVGLEASAITAMDSLLDVRKFDGESTKN